MCLTRRNLLVGGLAATYLTSRAWADEYPSGTIRIVVPFAAGGGGDIAMRVLTDELQRKLGTPVIIDNRPGPNGVAAALSVKAAAPDGYSIVALGNVHAIGQSLMKQAPFDLVNDFVPIATIAYADVVVYTAPNSPLNSLADAIAKAKTSPESFSIGSGIVGTTQNLTAELFRSTAQISSPIVSFRAPGDLLTAVTRGDVAIGFDLIPPIVGLLESGAFKALAVSSSSRFPRLPNTPTFQEGGIGTSVTSWAMIAAPARTPKPVIERLNKEVAAVLADPDVQAKFQQMGYTPGGGTPEDAQRMLVTEAARWKAVIQKANIASE